MLSTAEQLMIIPAECRCWRCGRLAVFGGACPECTQVLLGALLRLRTLPPAQRAMVASVLSDAGAAVLAGVVRGG